MVEIDPTVLAPAMAATLTAAGSSVITYAAMRRGKSGRINTTEADQLWNESTAIRRELREQIAQLERHISANEVDIAKLRAENAELKHEVLTLRTENQSLKVQVEQLRAENVELRSTQAAQGVRQDDAERGASL